MKYIKLGGTGLVVSKTAIGTVPIQRLDTADSVSLMRSAYEGGISYFDTSDNYTGSEEKLGAALKDVREKVIISTKVSTTGYEKAKEGIQQSLKRLNTSYIDIIQLHNPSVVPVENDPVSAYAALVEAKNQGYVRHIGFTNHDLQRAIEAAKSGLFETIQYPLNYLSGEKDEELIRLCAEKNIGLIAMKPFAGGMIKDPELTFMYFRAHENVVPIYGIQRMSELTVLLELEQNPPEPDEHMRQWIEQGRKNFAGLFCRGCDRCAKVCPQNIRVGYASRIGDFFYRNPVGKYLTYQWFEEMQRVPACTGCGECTRSCPFGLDLREAIQKNHAVFMDFWSRKEQYGVK